MALYSIITFALCRAAPIVIILLLKTTFTPLNQQNPCVPQSNYDRAPHTYSHSCPDARPIIYISTNFALLLTTSFQLHTFSTSNYNTVQLLIKWSQLVTAKARRIGKGGSSSQTYKRLLLLQVCRLLLLRICRCLLQALQVQIAVADLIWLPLTSPVFCTTNPLYVSSNNQLIVLNILSDVRFF